MNESVGDLFVLFLGFKRSFKFINTQIRNQSNLILVRIFKFTKNSVPNYQHTGVVLVDTIGIAAVMDSVMTGRVQNILEWSNRVDNLKLNN